MKSKSTFPREEKSRVPYRRPQRRLRPEEMASKVVDPENIQLFWEKVNKEGPFPDPIKYPDLKDRCWVWMGSTMKDHYGQVSKWNWSCLAHRFSYEMNVGHIPSTCISVCHKCDNPACVNPSHLFMGTHQDNMRDMKEKGRIPIRVGELHPRAKLTWEDVVSLRERYKNGESIRLLSSQYGMSQGSIGYAINGTNWKHVPNPIGLRTRKPISTLQSL